MTDDQNNLNQKRNDEANVLALFKPFEQFSKCMLDAYAVIDHTGKVVKCNPSLATMVGLTSKQVLKEASLDNILTLRVANKPLSVIEFLQCNAPTRFDEVSGDSSERKGLNLILGVYPFVHEAQTRGAFLLIRDVTAETNLQYKYTDKSQQSVTDALTGLKNRAYFVEDLKNRISAIESQNDATKEYALSVIMMDIDFFKKVNDVYGHQAGDYVIRTTAQLAQANFRKTDVLARYGGEEFLAILPDTDLQGAISAAEKLRIAVAEHRYEFEGKVIPLTISSGVAQIQIGREKGDQAIARADQALYFSKQNGRNRVSMHDGEAARPTIAPSEQLKAS